MVDSTQRWLVQWIDFQGKIRERKMRTNFFCTNFLNTPGRPGHPFKIPGTSQIPLFETQGRQTFEGGHELFEPHPFGWKTPCTPGGLQTKKVILCALFSCLRNPRQIHSALAQPLGLMDIPSPHREHSLTLALHGLCLCAEEGLRLRLHVQKPSRKSPIERSRKLAVHTSCSSMPSHKNTHTALRVQSPDPHYMRTSTTTRKMGLAGCGPDTGKVLAEGAQGKGTGKACRELTCHVGKVNAPRACHWIQDHKNTITMIWNRNNIARFEKISKKSQWNRNQVASKIKSVENKQFQIAGRSDLELLGLGHPRSCFTMDSAPSSWSTDSIQQYAD